MNVWVAIVVSLVIGLVVAIIFGSLCRGSAIGCCALCGETIFENDDYTDSRETPSPVHVDCYDDRIEKEPQ